MHSCSGLTPFTATPPHGRLSMLRTRISLCLLGVTTLVGALVGVSSTASAATPQIAGLASAVAEAAVTALADRGLDRSSAAKVLAAQPGRVRLADRLSRQLGARSAGAYLDRTGEVVVNVLDDASAGAVRAAGATA